MKDRKLFPNRVKVADRRIPQSELTDSSQSETFPFFSGAAMNFLEGVTKDKEGMAGISAYGDAGAGKPDSNESCQCL